VDLRKGVAPERREELFIRKIQQCKVLFDFTKPLVDIEQKEIKREVLLELVDYISTEKGVLTPPIYKELTEMVIRTHYTNDSFKLSPHFLHKKMCRIDVVLLDYISL
jgi:hypothetical protein